MSRLNMDRGIENDIIIIINPVFFPENMSFSWNKVLFSTNQQKFPNSGDIYLFFQKDVTKSGFQENETPISREMKLSAVYMTLEDMLVFYCGLILGENVTVLHRLFNKYFSKAVVLNCPC